MKTLVLAAILGSLCMTMCTSHKDPIKYERVHGTSIHTPIEGWKMDEYFVSRGKDTSAYSFVFDAYKGTTQPRMSVFFSQFHKLQFQNESNRKRDTTVIDYNEREIIMQDRFYLSNYENILHEMSLCMREASKKYHLKEMMYIETQLEYLGDPAATVSRIVSPEKIGDKIYHSHKLIDEALKSTSLREDINRTISDYGIEAENIFSSDIIEVFDKGLITKYHLFSDTTSVPNKLIEVKVRVTIRPKRN